MQTLLAPLARLASARPRLVLAGLLVVTVVLGGFAAGQSTDTELTAFAPDSELAAALDRVQVEFGAGGTTLQVIVDAGPGGDVVSRVGLDVASRVEAAVVAAGVDLAPDAVRSFAQPVVGRLAATGVDLDTADDATLAAAIAGALDDGAGALLSGDLDPATATARAGIVAVTLPVGLDDLEVARASVELADAARTAGAPGITVDPINGPVIGAELERQSTEEMPRLLGLSLLLIVAILMLQYRAVVDVVIGLAGLVATITWMTGFAVLLGPSFLGWVGPFTQISMIVPVLLVGLGIDYAIHLTSRYREERAHDLPPAWAASMAVRTVGGALVLATVTTVVGFLTNLASPLPPVTDFGIFTAIGVLSAFVIMTALVPSARNVVDQRRVLRARRAGAVRADRGDRRMAGGFATVIARTSIVAERVPYLAIATAVVLSVAAVGGASQLRTTFSQDDFIPADSEIGQLIERVDTLFGGDLSETTFVLVDADLTDPGVAGAMLAVHDGLAGSEWVRVDDGVARASSAPWLVASVAASDPALAARAEALGYRADTGFAADADVGALYQLVAEVAPAELGRVIAADATSGVVAVATTGGQDRARAVGAEVERLVAPLAAVGATVVVTSEPIVLEEALDALTASQSRGIVITLAAALVLLAAYYGVRERTVVLGAITMVPSVAVVTWVLGTMYLLGLSINVLTAMVASLGIGIGVPFGIHVTHRFLEDRRRYDTIDEAIRKTVTHTGGAMAGSAATTAAGFGVLVLASLLPIRQFGMIVAITIIYSFVAAVFVQPSLLKLWGEHRARRGDRAELFEHERRDDATLAHEPV